MTANSLPSRRKIILLRILLWQIRFVLVAIPALAWWLHGWRDGLWTVLLCVIALIGAEIGFGLPARRLASIRQKQVSLSPADLKSNQN